MAIKKQNQTLLIFVVVTLIILGYVLQKEGKLAFLFEQNEQSFLVTSTSIMNQDQMGNPVSFPNGAGSVDVSGESASQAFSFILSSLADCLEISSPEMGGDLTVQIETLIQYFQKQFGPVVHQADRWVHWNLKNKQGKEHRLRLEVTENDEGKMGRELHYFAFNQEGQPVPQELEPEKANNPTDEIINQLLKEGEVLSKERAAFVLFSSGERLEYVERDGELSEFEFFRGERYYRCHNLKARESCQCDPN